MVPRRQVLWSLCSAAAGIALSPIEAHAFKLRQLQLSVSDPRPVKVALAELEKRYTWVITYEDPPYVFPGELENVSQLPNVVLMDLPAQHLELAQPLPEPSSNPDRVTLVNQVIAADGGLVGRSRFEQRSSSFGTHVVPTAFRDATGAWTVAESILDRDITMPSNEVTAMQYLEAYCDVLATAIGKPVTLATAPYRLLASRPISLAASSQSASSVLIAVLQSLQTPLTWRLLCSPEPNRGYFLNIVTPG